MVVVGVKERSGLRGSMGVFVRALMQEGGGGEELERTHEEVEEITRG